MKTDGSINIDVGNDYSVLDENWAFRLKAISSDSSTNSMVEYDFVMTLRDGCLLDELSSPSTIEGFDYYIAATGL